MEREANETNENIRSTINNSDDIAPEDLSLSNNQQENNDGIKLSEPASEEAGTMVSEGKVTTNRLLKAVENSSSLDSNSTNITPTTMTSNLIIDLSSSIDYGDVQPCQTPRTDHIQFQSQLTTTTINNASSRSHRRKHVMISYNRATATPTCKKIYEHLIKKGYNVWFDRTNLPYGSILDAMGEAVDNAYVVLLCINEGYSKSNYCLKEAKYAVESKVPIIPCMMEDQFQPRGGLGLIKSDLKHIEFFDENKFDESFEELTTEIDAIATGSQTTSVIMDNTNFRDRFRTILNEHMQSIQQCSLRDQRNLDETELWTLVQKFIQEFSPETWQSFQNDLSNEMSNQQMQQGDNNDRLIQHILVNNERLAELFRLQQENHAWIEQHLLEQDERLTAFHHFQRRQEEQNARTNPNERLISQIYVEGMQRRDNERNNRIIRQLEQKIEQLTELIINDRGQHAIQMQTMHQLVIQSLEASANAQQQQRTSRLDFDLLKIVIETIVILCTLLVLFKNL